MEVKAEVTDRQVAQDRVRHYQNLDGFAWGGVCFCGWDTYSWDERKHAVERLATHLRIKGGWRKHLAEVAYGR